MSSTTLPKFPPSPPPDKPKTLWESILTSTPVVLTVVATLLAGLSSSEMSRAQYHRALAAQHQSKVADQWGFFQAKRTRGTTLESEVELLRTRYGSIAVTSQTIAKAGERLPSHFDRAALDVERLRQALRTAKLDDTAAKSLQVEAETLLRAAREHAETARANKQQIDAALARPELAKAFPYLSTAEFPSVPKTPVGDPNIREAVEAIRARKTETETAELMSQIDEEQVRRALDAAEADARALDAKTKPMEEAFNELGRLLDAHSELAGAFHRAVETFTEGINAALADTPATKENAQSELRNAVAALARTSAALQKEAGYSQTFFITRSRDFTARRYDHEARDNERIAGILEIQVRKSSWESERHRRRSQLFFIGMLVAQAGVTIATFSLALRKRNVLWAFATVAGVAAIFFSAYVYLYT